VRKGRINVNPANEPGVKKSEKRGCPDLDMKRKQLRGGLHVGGGAYFHLSGDEANKPSTTLQDPLGGGKKNCTRSQRKRINAPCGTFHRPGKDGRRN